MNQLRTLLNSIKQTPLLNLILWTFFSMALLTARVIWTGEITFVFLAWNLFLAWVPWIFSKAISTKQRGWKQLGLLVGWILFFPNAPYILTDLFHLKLRLVMPLWFDLLLILSFAVSGLLLATQSLHIMRKWLRHYISVGWTELATVGYLFLTAFGIYLGRFYRWNSWDLTTRPVELIYDVLIAFRHPFQHYDLWTFTLGVGAFLYLLYRTTKVSKEEI